MASLHTECPEVVVLNVDIKSWGSPVCSQYGITGVPYAILVEPSGRTYEGDAAFAALAQQLKKHR